MLSIHDYDEAESEAISRASYPAIRAFRPVAFAQSNFPTRVQVEAELLRYADIMHELADRDFWYRQMLYSPDERTAILGLSEAVEALTRQAFGRGIQPFMCLFPPIPICRAVNALSLGRPVKIFEIGPGSGYLGAYLIMAGHSYWATDNTQALYLWQDRLFSYLARDSFANLAVDPTDRPARVTLLPWWQFADLFRSPPEADIIICDAAMGEMDTFAVNYVTHLAAEMLARSPIGALLFSNIGEQRINNLSYVHSCFERLGLVCSHLGSVTAYSRRAFAAVAGLSQIGPGEPKPAQAFLPLDRSKLLESYAFFDFINLAPAKSSPAPAPASTPPLPPPSLYRRAKFYAIRKLRKFAAAGRPE